MIRRFLSIMALSCLAFVSYAQDLGVEAGAEIGFGDVADEVLMSVSPLLK